MNIPGAEDEADIMSLSKNRLMTRRNFLKGVGALGAGIAGCAFLGHHNAQQLSIREESISGPASLRGLRMMFLTDPHTGGNIDTIAHTVSLSTQVLLTGSTHRNQLILHGGDFVSQETSVGDETSEVQFREIIPQLFSGLERFSNFGVTGNHDDEHSQFPNFQERLKIDHGIHFLEKPQSIKYHSFQDSTVAIHGIHTLVDYLKYLTKKERDSLLDEYIDALNNGPQAMNVVLLHNPDGLQYLLERLKETDKSIEKMTYFFAGHTHGGMVDIPGIKDFALSCAHTEYERYKGWYGPEGDFSDTGNWKMYVSTGMGNSPFMSQRFFASPEVVNFIIV